jgi:hypothetical protein
MAGLEKLFNGKILNKSNQQIDLNDEQYQGKVIGLYFSAHWFGSFDFISFHFCYVLGVHHAVDSLRYSLNSTINIIKIKIWKLF